MKKFLIALAVLAVMVFTFGLPSATATADQPDHAGEKVTICHYDGLAGTTKNQTLTIGWPAVYGPAGHFYENGTPRAGHEQDTLGPCPEEVTPTPTETVTPTPTPTETVVVTPTPTVTVTETPVVTPTVPSETPVAVAPPVKTQKPTPTPTKTHKAKPTHPAHPVTPVTPATPHRKNLAHTGAADTALLGGLGLGLTTAGIVLYRRFAPVA